jgi:hypothetical protein
MKKSYIVGLAFAAVFAFFALSVTSAFAVNELLVDNAAIAASTNVHLDIAGELLLEDTGATLSPAVLCSGLFEAETGTEGGGKLFFITALQPLTGTATEANMLECPTEKTCSGESLVTARNLPWHIEIELMAAGANEWLAVFLNEAGKIPTYAVLCTVLGVAVEDVCEGASSARLENNAEGILGLFNKAAESENAECSQSKGHKDGVIESDGGVAGLITEVGGLTLALS